MTEYVEATAEGLYQTLSTNAGSERFRTSLERVSKVCNALEKQGTPITAAAVGHQCTEMFGGPKIQSIRNSKDGLALYIRKRAAEQKGVVTKKGAARDRPPIMDESVRAYVRTLEVQLEQANSELQRVKAGLRQLAPLDTRGLGSLLAGTPLPQPDTGIAASVPKSVKDDLRAFLEPRVLSSCGIKEASGELNFASGLVLLRREGLQFIRAIVSK